MNGFVGRAALVAIAVFSLVVCSLYPNEDRSPPIPDDGDWECVGCDDESPPIPDDGDWECVGCDGGPDVDADGDCDSDADADGDVEYVLMCIHPDDGEPYEDYVHPDDVATLIEHGDYVGECKDPVDPLPPDEEPDGDADVDVDVDGDVDVDVDADADGDDCYIPDCREGKALVCHVPPGNPENAHWICVGVPAVQAHERHGDDPDFCCR